MTPNQSSIQSEYPSQYLITIQGHMPPHWAKRFEDMEILNTPDGTSTLVAEVPDQAALYGLIIKLRDMGLTLLIIRRM